MSASSAGASPVRVSTSRRPLRCVPAPARGVGVSAVDAAAIAGRFRLGYAARLSDGPVARGKQALVWRLETADGSWAVETAFHPTSEDDVRLATAFHEATHRAGVPSRPCAVRRTGRVFATVGGGRLRVYERGGVAPGGSAAGPRARRRRRRRHANRGDGFERAGRSTSGTATLSAASAGVSSSMSCRQLRHRPPRDWRSCVRRWSRWNGVSSRPAALQTCHRDGGRTMWRRRATAGSERSTGRTVDPQTRPTSWRACCSSSRAATAAGSVRWPSLTTTPTDRRR